MDRVEITYYSGRVENASYRHKRFFVRTFPGEKSKIEKRRNRELPRVPESPAIDPPFTVHPSRSALHTPLFTPPTPYHAPFTGPSSRVRAPRTGDGPRFMLLRRGLMTIVVRHQQRRGLALAFRPAAATHGGDAAPRRLREVGSVAAESSSRARAASSPSVSAPCHRWPPRSNATRCDSVAAYATTAGGLNHHHHRRHGEYGNLRENLDKWLGTDVDSGLWEVCREVRANGGTAWLVGGCVRDALLGGSPKDIDLATDLVSDRLLAIFGPEDAKATGEGFGTVTVTAGIHKTKYEITTLRREGQYTDGRRPDVVEYTSDIEEDLGRRDFTINAIAFDPLSGALVDPFGGLGDLETSTLRVVLANAGNGGGPTAFDRMNEDGLRIWRAYRFLDDGRRATRSASADLEACLDDPRTRKQAASVSVERIWVEMHKILGGQSAPHVLRKMARNGMLGAAFELGEDVASESDPRLEAQDYLLRCRRRLQEEVFCASGGREIAGEAKTFIALDLEATCSEENNTFPQEVIQLSATMFATDDAADGGMGIVDTFDSLCQPVIHKDLTPFCTELTGITQGDVAGSPKFKKVLGNFQAWLQSHSLLDPLMHLTDGAVLLTCGCWDLGKLVPIQCKANYYNIPMPPFLRYYCDVQEVFSSYYWSGNQNYTSLAAMTARLGVQREGRAHDALNDSRDLARLVHAMRRDGCARFPAQYYDAKNKSKMTQGGEAVRENPRRHMPEIAVARAAILLSQAETSKAQKWMLRTGWSRNEDKKVIKAALTAFKAFPKGTGSLTEMAAYKRFVGPRMRFQLCLQSALVCGVCGWLSPEHLACEEVGRRLLAMRDVEPLADGAWIMERTGLAKGMKLGRLKEWLWKLQIERGATDLGDMAQILAEIDWENTEVDTWPRFLQLK